MCSVRLVSDTTQSDNINQRLVDNRTQSDAGKSDTTLHHFIKTFMLLNIQESANFAKVARSTIYANISSGKLSKSSDGMIDTSELLRVFGSPNGRDKTRKKKQIANIEKTQETSLEVELLREKIRFLESNLSEAKNREEWLKGQVDKLTEAVKLLEPPKTKINGEPKQEKQGFFSRFLSR